jgi:hypothetical protein
MVSVGMKFGRLYKTLSSSSVARNGSHFSPFGPFTKESIKQFHTTAPRASANAVNAVNAANTHCITVPIEDPMIKVPHRDPVININPYSSEFPVPGQGIGTMFFPQPYSALARFQQRPNIDGFFAIYLCRNKRIHEMGHFMCREFRSVREAKAHLNMINCSSSSSSRNLDVEAIVKISLIYPRSLHRLLLENRLSQLFIKVEIEDSE